MTGVALVYIGLSADLVLVTLLAVRSPWPDWPHVAVPIGWTIALAGATIGVAGVGWILSLLLQWRRKTERPSVGRGTLPFSAGRIARVVTALGLTLALVVGFGWLAMKWGTSLSRCFTTHETRALLLAAVVGVVFLALRWFLIEYVGDVAIYTCAYKVSRFNDIRRQIQDVGRRAYADSSMPASPPGQGDRPYESIFVVGHSLEIRHRVRRSPDLT